MSSSQRLAAFGNWVLLIFTGPLGPLIVLFASSGRVREHARWSLIALLLYNVLAAVFLVPFVVLSAGEQLADGVTGWIGLAAGLLAAIFYLQFLVLIAVNLVLSLVGRRPYRGVYVRLYTALLRRG